MMTILSPSLGVDFKASSCFPYPIPPANIITLSNPYFFPDSMCSNVNTEPLIIGCPNLFPKSDAPLDAFIRMSIGVWYSHFLSSIAFSHFLSLSNLE